MAANKMKMEDTGSTNPHHVGYDEPTKILVAQFKGDTLYAYPDTDPVYYQELQEKFDGKDKTQSAGEYFMATFSKRLCVRLL